MRIVLPLNLVNSVYEALHPRVEMPRTGKQWVALIEELAEIGLPTYAKRRRKYKRGEYSDCGKFRFLQYQSYVRKDGLRAERWIPADEYDEYLQKQREAQALCEARRDWNQMQAAKKQQPK